MLCRRMNDAGRQRLSGAEHPLWHILFQMSSFNNKTTCNIKWRLIVGNVAYFVFYRHQVYIACTARIEHYCVFSLTTFLTKKMFCAKTFSKKQLWSLAVSSYVFLQIVNELICLILQMINCSSQYNGVGRHFPHTFPHLLSKITWFLQTAAPGTTTADSCHA